MRYPFGAVRARAAGVGLMVTISTRRAVSQEAGVKYFFLGAFGASIFLYGFTLIYGATGHTEFGAIRQAVVAQSGGGEPSTLFVAGLVHFVVVPALERGRVAGAFGSGAS